MDDLISRKAVLDKFNRNSDMWSALTDEETSKEFWLFCRVADALDDIPSVPAVPLDKLCELCEETDARVHCVLCDKIMPEWCKQNNNLLKCGEELKCPTWKQLLTKWMEGQNQ